MRTPSLVDLATDAVGQRRSEVLALLRDSDRPLSVTEVAEATARHVNTARFHLDALVADGLAERCAEEREVPGRPRMLYTARATVPGPRSYGLLAEMLTGLVASLHGAGPAAVEAGRAWGRHLVDRPAPSIQMGAGEAMGRLTGVLDAVGFQPEPDPGDAETPTQIRLHHCPFREVAERHTDVVCAIHLGLMQGALEELRGPVETTSLEPFVTPTVCVATLRTSASTP